MYRVPFILWRSDTHQENLELVEDRSRKYMTDDLIYSVAQLCQVDFEGRDLTRSIFAKEFQEKERRVFQGLTYEELVDKEAAN